MNTLLSLAILSVSTPAPIDPNDAQTVEVFRCDFEAQTDANYDGWPDGWQRRRDRQYPIYVKMGIVADRTRPSAETDNCFRIGMNGGAAAVFSPPIVVSPQFSYGMDGLLRIERLRHDVVYSSVTLFDDQDHLLDTFYSRRFRSAEDWTQIQIGPLAFSDSRVRKAVIGLHVEPTDKADLSGAAFFDDVRLLRFPRMQLTTKRRHNVYYEDEPVEVTSEISGISEPDPLLRFELFDVQGNSVAALVQRLDGRPVDAAEADGEKDQGFVGQIVWRMPIDDFGFYRLRVTLKGRADLQLQRETTLVKIRRRAKEPSGEFGWSLPECGPLEDAPLADLLSRAGIHWVKVPFAYDEDDQRWAKRTSDFIERLSVENIEVVGVLDRRRLSKSDGNVTEESLVAAMFAHADLWQQFVDPLMTRLSLKVRWWQLGNDWDTSFVGFPNLANKISEIKQHLERFGQRVKLGLVWHWLHQAPDTANPPWEFLSHTVEPPFTQHELEAYLEGNRADAAQTWVTLQPLPREKYDLETRVLDLVQRMLATKVKKADAVFLPNPFSPDHGVMKPDGTPSELLLPWQTTAALLSGADFLGSIQLPGGSRNYVFSHGDRSVMVVWNDRPTLETVYLGDDVHVVDAWGRESIPDREQNRQVIEAGRLPKFITGVNTAVTKWRLGFQFDRYELDSVFGRPQLASFRLQNAFPQGVSGTMTLHTPATWEAKKRFPIKVSPGGEYRESFPVTLRAVANTGKQQVRMDFEITADRDYKFSVYREMQVGLGDVVIELSTRINEHGHLVVTQTLINYTKEFVSFDCTLYVPSRRRQRTHVLDAGEGRHTRIYFYPDGNDLLGSTVHLRAREISGQRILNYQAKVGL